NLHGATPQGDREDFARLWNGFCPDEIKIYPNQLLANAELYEVWQRGEYRPYTTEELVELITDIKPTVPRYCRINRVIRDIPSTNVVEGNKRTSLRQDVHAEMARRGTKCQCVRCREVRKATVDVSALKLTDLVYPAANAEEHFISFDTAEDGLAGFVRLSLPAPLSPPKYGENQPDLGGSDGISSQSASENQPDLGGSEGISSQSASENQPDLGEGKETSSQSAGEHQPRLRVSGMTPPPNSRALHGEFG
ncbi:MAG: hypothetical protein R6W69_00270, partial [Anaerolineales bacterium]